jgi:hypothetical protein
MEIKHRYTGTMLMSIPVNTLVGVNLNGVHLSGAMLSMLDLSWIHLRDADLSRADLKGANFSGADLKGANFSDADLNAVVGNMREIKSMQVDTWSVVWTADTLQIGCQRHPIADWWEFDDDKIAKMDERALPWWRKWKPLLQSIIAAAHENEKS